MRDLRPPFKFDIARLLARFRSLPIGAEATVTIGLPGVKITAKIAMTLSVVSLARW